MKYVQFIPTNGNNNNYKKKDLESDYSSETTFQNGNSQLSNKCKRMIFTSKAEQTIPTFKSS